MKRAILLTSILVVWVGCVVTDTALAQSGNQKIGEPSKTRVSDQKKGRQEASSEQTVIGHLQSRNKIVTVTRGPKGVFYTIKTKDGKTLATKLAEKDLQAKYPDVYHQIKSGVAANDATLR